MSEAIELSITILPPLALSIGLNLSAQAMKLPTFMPMTRPNLSRSYSLTPSDMTLSPCDRTRTSRASKGGEYPSIAADRKRVVQGQRVSVRVDLGGCCHIEKKQH